MSPANTQLRPSGKGFVLAELGKGLPSMRRLVETYTGADKRKYIKLDGEITPLLPKHLYLPGN